MYETLEGVMSSANMTKARRYGVFAAIFLIILSGLGALLDRMEVHQTNFVRFSHHEKSYQSTIGSIPAWPSSCGPTHPEKSKVSLVSVIRGSDTIPWSPNNNTPVTVLVGDVLNFTLEARDVNGRAKIMGGDYWFAIMEDANIRASIVGRILDHENGLYTLLFVAAWRGMIRLRITLVHPAELAKWLRTEYLHGMRAPSWSGMFKLGEITERTSCVLSFDAIWTNKCTTKPSHALRYSLIICDPPKSLPCDALVGLYGSPLLYTKDLKKRLSTSRLKYLHSPYYYATLQNVPTNITVNDTRIKPHLLSNESPDLPACEPGMPSPLTEGYWWNRTWFSLTCGPRIPLTRTSVQLCLRDVNVFFTGDSTTRQWFAAITEVLGLGLQEDHQRVFTLRRRDEEANLNLTFIFHPLTAHPRSVFVNLSTVKFEADVILELPRHTCRNVVVFSPWAHFSIWQWEAYTDWLKGIREAILVARQRCPDLVVVAKSPHPVDKWSLFPARDIVFDEMRKLTRDIFENIGVIFVDIWDMNLASPWPITLHMPNDVITKEVSVLLSYLCPLLNNKNLTF